MWKTHVFLGVAFRVRVREHENQFHNTTFLGEEYLPGRSSTTFTRSPPDNLAAIQVHRQHTKCAKNEDSEMNGLYRLSANPKGVSKTFWTNINNTRKTINDSKVRSAPIPPVATPQGSTFKDAADYAMFSVLISSSKSTLPPFSSVYWQFPSPTSTWFQLKNFNNLYLHSAIPVVMSSSDPPPAQKISLHLYGTQKKHNKYLPKEGRSGRGNCFTNIAARKVL